LKFNFQDKDKMSKKNNQLSFRLIFIISTIIFATTLTLPGCKKQPVEQAHTEHNHNKPSPSAPMAESPSKPVALPQVKPGTDIIASPKTSLSDVVRAARTWRPVYNSWYGKLAPDFALSDIKGKQHKLSEYRGKNVMLIFWATWCGPCIMEIPHLIALRNTIDQGKLAMLAVSYISTFPPETTEKVKDFVEQNKINYTVFSTDMDAMPSPFSRVSSIPCSFFIDSQGRIKLAAEGLLSLGEIKAILQAE
jgi:peroxiredoxin